MPDDDRPEEEEVETQPEFREAPQMPQVYRRHANPKVEILLGIRTGAQKFFFASVVAVLRPQPDGSP